MKIKELLEERNKIKIEVYKGEFWKSCPGTTAGYYCCGYQVLTPLRGCGMYCRYCILQAYFENQFQVLFKNWKDLKNEVEKKLEKWSGVVRIGTGEFADSLYLEDKLKLCKKVADLFDKYPNVLTEFKTKSNNISLLNKIRNPQKVVIGFSMNTPKMINLFEKKTATLKQRLEAAKRCLDMGFWISFHFDPIFWYKEWKEEYMNVVNQIFSVVKDTKRIAWWSLGGFRSPLALKMFLKKINKHLPLYSMGELVYGEDGKVRYYRPIRAELYFTFNEEIKKVDPDITLYLCMESPELWQDSGMINRIPNGLVKYLDERAKQILRLK